MLWVLIALAAMPFVPEPIKQPPYLPSIESAFAQGYRRPVIDPIYTKTDVFLERECFHERDPSGVT
jgi:hypothetical protein